MTKFLSNIQLEQATDIQFKTTAGTNAGKISQDGNNLVLTNAVGDILLGDGSADVYIGDGTNNVDIIFEQSGAIKGDGSAVTLTLGGANTTLNLENPNINGNATFAGTIGSGAITSTGKITGTELEGTSLDINGNADISGNLTVHDQIITTAPGSLLQAYKSAWSNGTNQDVLYQSWNTYVDDFVYLKAPGNSTTSHGIALIGDNVIAFGRTNAETGSPELTSAAAPLNNNWLVLNTTGATFAGDVTVSGGDITLGGTGRIQGVDTVSAGSDAANKTYVDTSISNLIGGAPAALDTLNELAAAINDDASYASTLTTALATKLPLAGGTMTGPITIDYAAGTNPLLSLFNDTNGGGAKINFSDQSTPSQNGTLMYVHSDGASYGTGNAFVFSGTETSMNVVALGNLVYRDGIYKTPSSGTGVGTRKDANWDTAYTHSQAAHAPSNANNYIHPTTAGNKHIPTGGSSGQFLRYSSSGTATWATPDYIANTNTHTHLDRTDNRTISPSEFSAGDLNFGFTSWGNNNTSPYADFLHLRSYTDSSGGSDNMVTFKKSGIGMRIWQQSFGSSTAYSDYEEVWHTGNLTTTNKANYDTAYGWGDHGLSAQDKTDIGNLSGTNTGDQTLPTLASLGAAPVKSFSIAGVNSSTYVTAFTVNGNNLASSLKMTLTGTSGSVVVNAVFEILVNHSLDILVSSTSGFYTKPTIKITSNNNEDFAVEVKHNGSSTTTLACEVFSLTNDTITPATSHSYTGSSLEHTADYGTRHSATGGSTAHIKTDGNITAAGGNSTEWNTAYDKTLQWNGGATGLVASTGRTSLGLGSLATLNSVAAGQIDANAVNASELNVSGNGTTSQYLRSDGDGTMSWATPPDNNTTYSVGDGGLTQKNFTTTLKTKLDGIATSANNYTLPFTNNSTNWNTAYSWGDHAVGGYAELNHIRSLGTQAFTSGSNPNITTAQVMAEIESDGGFDSFSSVFKTSWSYAGNYNLTDAGDFSETAGSSWITWTDNSSDSTRGNITALAIAPNSGSSAGGVFIYNDQGGGYNPGWRQVWTSMTDGSGSGLDADLLDGQEGAHYLARANHTGTQAYSTLTGTPSVGDGGLTQKNFTTTLKSKLDGIAASANNYTLPFTNNSTNWNTAYGWGNHAGLYLSLGGGTMSGDVDMGGNRITDGVFVTQSGTSDDFVKGDGTLDSTAYTTNTGTLTDSNDRNYITDSRGAARAPSYYNDRYAQWDFQSSTDTGAGGDGWHGLLTVAKWTVYDGSHRQEQLLFTGNDLKRRTASSDSAWGTTKTIWDSGNLANPAKTNVANNFTQIQKITLSEPKLQLQSNSSPSLMAGMHTQVGGQLLGYGTNFSQLGARNTSYAGGFFRIDVRSGYTSQFFTVQRVTGTGTETVLLTVNSAGDLTTTGNITELSDERLKSDVKTVDNALDKVNALRGVTFMKNGKRSLGVIAQEIEKVLPEVVVEGKEYKSVAYGNIVGVLIEAIKEQDLKIERLEKMVELMLKDK